MSTIETASQRMKSQGYRPFSPDAATCPTQRWLRDSDMPPEIARTADRMDALIAIFALGVALGWLVGAGS